jgi:hypothetical protein
MAIDIVYLPIQNSDFPVRYVSVPEGITPNQSSAVADRSRDRKNHATNEMLYIYTHPRHIPCHENISHHKSA